MLRYSLLVLLFVSFTSARFRGNSAFVVEDVEEYDQDGNEITVAPTTEEALQETKQPVKTVTPSTSAETSASSVSTSSSKTTTEDGRDPMEVVEAAVDLLNTPMHQMVGSNPLRRLLRLVGPTKNDFVRGIQLTREVQEATGHSTVQPLPTEIPSVVNNLFGFQQNDDDLFRKTTTLAPLFPVYTYDHDAVYKYLNKMMAESAAKTTGAPVPKL